MLKRSILLCSLAVLVAAVSSCIFDPKPAIDPPPPVNNQKFEDLTQMWHVLNNLELAYNKRNIIQYDKILDLNFTFFLTPGDVGGVDDLPEQWGRADEVKYNTDLLNTNYTGPNRCKTVSMDLTFEPDKIQWTALTPGSAPDETWYFATIYYRFKFDVEPDTQYESFVGAHAQFTVRNAGTDAAPHWQLVEFRELEGP